MGKIVQTAGRTALGEYAPQFAHFNDDVLFGENWNNQDIDVKTHHPDCKLDGYVFYQKTAKWNDQQKYKILFHLSAELFHNCYHLRFLDPLRFHVYCKQAAICILILSSETKIED